MFGQFKEKLHAVQQDLSEGFKSLSVKAQKVSKTNRNSDTLDWKQDSLPTLRDGLHISAGADLLNRFQENWTQIHEDLEESAQNAAIADSKIQEITFAQDRQMLEWKNIRRQLQDIPQLLEDIQHITANIGKLAADFEEVETSLLELEDVIEEQDHRRNEDVQHQELEIYKKQKLYEENLLKVRLQEEFNERLQKKQKEEDAKMKERQQAFQEFFVADLNHYKEFGKMERSKDVASQETHLEDLELEWDEDDQQALNDFLGPSEDNESKEMERGDETRKDAVASKDEDGKKEEEGEEEEEIQTLEEVGEVKMPEEVDDQSEKVRGVSENLKDDGSDGGGIEGGENLEDEEDVQPDVPRDEETVKEDDVAKSNIEEDEVEDSDEFQDAVDE
ncbi:Dysbindin-A [Holothuria leucospilota]|uniref:Dysbindin-A n=1 Tax=Holothuria leucospilota TaxID=206669 RepID=A0A9Q1HDF5_HOLLE|nr:Dysbindin-A [Holothuria leucospilota]